MSEPPSTPAAPVASHDAPTPPRGTPRPSERGLIDDTLTRLLGRSWRTSLLGALTIGCGIVTTVPGLPPLLVDVCTHLLPYVVGTGFLTAKDRQVSGPPPRTRRKDDRHV